MTVERPAETEPMTAYELEIANRWAPEILRRVGEVKGGVAMMVDYDVAMARVREHVASLGAMA